VVVTLRVVRLRRRAPSTVSSRVTIFESAEGVSFKSRAAAEKLPRSTARTNASISPRSPILPTYHRPSQMIFRRAGVYRTASLLEGPGSKGAPHDPSSLEITDNLSGAPPCGGYAHRGRRVPGETGAHRRAEPPGGHGGARGPFHRAGDDAGAATERNRRYQAGRRQHHRERNRGARARGRLHAVARRHASCPQSAAAQAPLRRPNSIQPRRRAPLHRQSLRGAPVRPRENGARVDRSRPGKAGRAELRVFDRGQRDTPRRRSISVVVQGE